MIYKISTIPVYVFLFLNLILIRNLSGMVPSNIPSLYELTKKNLSSEPMLTKFTQNPNFLAKIPCETKSQITKEILFEDSLRNWLQGLYYQNKGTRENNIRLNYDNLRMLTMNDLGTKLVTISPSFIQIWDPYNNSLSESNPSAEIPISTEINIKNIAWDQNSLWNIIVIFENNTAQTFDIITKKCTNNFQVTQEEYEKFYLEQKIKPYIIPSAANGQFNETLQTWNWDKSKKIFISFPTMPSGISIIRLCDYSEFCNQLKKLSLEHALALLVVNKRLPLNNADFLIAQLPEKIRRIVIGLLPHMNWEEIFEKNRPFQCASCNKAGISVLQRCSRCKQAWYCSRKCQQKDWKIHREFCMKS